MMNEREMEVLNILHGSEKPLMATDIVNMHIHLTQSTVTAVLRKLLHEELIKIDGVTHSGKVLSRTYKVTPKAKEYVLNHYKDVYKITNNIVSAQEIAEVLK